VRCEPLDLEQLLTRVTAATRPARFVGVRAQLVVVVVAGDVVVLLACPLYWPCSAVGAGVPGLGSVMCNGNDLHYHESYFSVSPYHESLLSGEKSNARPEVLGKWMA
jgi:hypothetical protein